MESTKEQFKRVYSAFRAAGGSFEASSFGHTSPTERFVLRDARERLARLPKGAHEALRGERQAPKLSKSAYDKAEQILLKALPLGAKDHTRLRSHIYDSALDRMILGENRQNKKPEHWFMRE